MTQGTFISALLAPYFQKNHKAYLEENIDQPKMHDVIDKLRTSAERDAGAPKIAASEVDKVELIKSVATYVDYCLDGKKENKPLVLFRFLVWFDGFDRDILSTPVYQDVATQVKKWRLTLGLKLYVLSNGWNMATQKFLEKTTQGNLSSLVHDFMDTDLGPLTSPETFQKVIAIVRESPENIVFLTKSPDEARAARLAGINGKNPGKIEYN